MRRAQGQKLNKFIKPMLAKETEKPFDDTNWIFEIKWDGYRAISEITKKGVLLYSRNGIDFSKIYAPITESLKKIRHPAILDGEIVVLNNDGISDFQKLQDYRNNNDANLCYYVFDILSLNNTNTCKLPLDQRKKLLKKLVTKNNVIKYSDHIVGDGKAFFSVAKKKNMEGIMAKKADSLYYPGVRTNDWLKIKHHKSQDVIIAGFTKPRGSRKYFGALVLAARKGKKIVYAGHTGSGFDDILLREVYDQLKPLITNESPFEQDVKTNAPVTWVEPKLICEVKYTEITKSGIMRHPIFLRMRNDKSLKEL